MDEVKEPQPVTFSTKPHLRPDGEFVCMTLTQGDVEIQLTAEQCRSLSKVMTIYLKENAR